MITSPWNHTSCRTIRGTSSDANNNTLASSYCTRHNKIIITTAFKWFKNWNRPNEKNTQKTLHRGKGNICNWISLCVKMTIARTNFISFLHIISNKTLPSIVFHFFQNTMIHSGSLGMSHWDSTANRTFIDKVKWEVLRDILRQDWIT